MSAPPLEPESLRHLGLIYDTPDDLAATALPELRAALERGDDVTLIVDRRVARAVREHLGPVADRAYFPPPRDVLGPGGLGALRALRERVPEGRAVREGGRALLVSQSDLTSATDAEFLEIEQSVGPTLAGLPLTVLCCYAIGADPCHTEICRFVHARLLTDAGTVDNPDHRPPEDAAAPPASCAAPALWLAFRGTADLRRLREGVARAASEVGLRGEPAEAAVLAVHEAAVLACLAVADAPESDDCQLEVHTDDGALTSEIRAPGGLATPSSPDPLAHIRPFCRSITQPHEHVIRVVTDADWGFGA